MEFMEFAGERFYNAILIFDRFRMIEKYWAAPSPASSNISSPFSTEELSREKGTRPMMDALRAFPAGSSPAAHIFRPFLTKFALTLSARLVNLGPE
jgi:hypothetical protein